MSDLRTELKNSAAFYGVAVWSAMSVKVYALMAGNDAVALAGMTWWLIGLPVMLAGDLIWWAVKRMWGRG